LTTEQALRADPTEPSAEGSRAPTEPKGWVDYAVDPANILTAGFVLAISGGAGVLLLPYDMIIMRLASHIVGITGVMFLIAHIILLDYWRFMK